MRYALMTGPKLTLQRYNHGLESEASKAVISLHVEPWLPAASYINVVWLTPFIAVMLTSVRSWFAIVTVVSFPPPPFVTFQLRQSPVTSTVRFVLTIRSYFFGLGVHSWKTNLQDLLPQYIKGSLLSHKVPVVGTVSISPHTQPSAIVP